MCYSAMQAQAAKSKFGDFHFKARIQPDLGDEPIFPLQAMAFGRLDREGHRESLVGQYGLVPPWVSDEHKGPKFGRNTYNARSETIFEKPSFKSAILHQRAVIPVVTFFEFPDNEKPLKHRYHIERKDGQAFWLAAIWAYSPRYELTSCSVITAGPMSLIAEVHSRSPVILADGQIEAWLDPALQTPDGIVPFLKTHGSKDFALVKEDWKPAKKKAIKKIIPGPSQLKLS